MVSRKAPLVLHLVHSLEGGGTERVLISLLRTFDHRVMRHAVVTLRDAGSLSQQLPDEVACVPLGAVGRSRIAGFRLAKVCARLQPAVIHARNVCTWADAVVARMLNPGTELVLGFHGLQEGGNFTRRDRCAARIARILGARFTSVSEHGRQQMVRELTLPSGRITRLPNGIDFSRFTAHEPSLREKIRESLGYAPNDFVVGIVGSLMPVKGHDVLLAAFAHVATNFSMLRLLIVGDGPLRKSLEATARQLAIHDRVQFVGQRNEVPTLLNAMNAYVCSSHSEGMSNAVLEAMAAGLPVISTMVGDHPAMIRNRQDGFLVPVGDTRAMAQAVETLLKLPDFAAKMGQSAWERMHDFSIGRTVEAYERFYHNLAFQHCEPQPHGFVAACRKVSSARGVLAWPQADH